VARIFLCHASDDKAHVREVYHRLQAIEGFEPWLDEEDLLPGQEWAREIPRVLQTSDFILIFLSRTSVAKRGYVQRKMKMALDAWQEMPEGAIHTIPVRLDDCDVPEQFRRYHWANLGLFARCLSSHAGHEGGRANNPTMHMIWVNPRRPRAFYTAFSCMQVSHFTPSTKV
jgi:hypothetical protein